MPAETNSNAMLADYSEMAACLFAIQEQETNGSFSSNPEALALIRNLEGDVLRKLYNRTFRILGTIDGVIDLKPEHLLGDFGDEEFLGSDFHTGYLDNRNTGYSSSFQTILNIFTEFARRYPELTAIDKQNLDAALIPVLDAFENLQNYLTSVGLNPCITSSYFNNSANLYLQAAGSDGTDGTAEGIHLRWSLAGELGNNHFAKGDLGIASTAGYNKINDYAHIYRTPYINPVRLTINFATDKPAINFNAKRWTYVLNTTVNGKILSTRIRLLFEDKLGYDQLAAIINPQVDPYNFLKLYDGLLNLELSKKTAFAIGFGFKKGDSDITATMKLEVFSSFDTNPESNETLTVRKAIEVSSSTPVNENIKGENIHRIIIKKTPGSYLESFSFETYSDFISSKIESDWTQLESGFGLSLTDQAVYDRIENSRYIVDNNWPHFNGAAKVRVANYEDKWSTSRTDDPSIKEVVQQYLSLSQTDPRAIGILQDEGADPEAQGLMISYLDMLNLMALDYHIARMLGVGYIDTPASVSAEHQFIYKISYTSRKSMGSSKTMVSEYLSLPTGKSDNRSPLKPEMRPVTYELPVRNELADTMFDTNGYASNANVRIVNIGRKPFSDEIETGFLTDLSLAEGFNVFEHTKPVLYGVEYRPSTQVTYVKPEITSEKSVGHNYYAYDPDYPVTGVLETTPVPDNLKSLYIHFLKQTGEHRYAIYGINWFSRTSILSDEVSTDITVFPKKNTLLPPSDVAVQYIQKEDTLLFTTETEQTWLEGRSQAFEGQDVNFTRIIFNWLDIIDVSDREAVDIVKPDQIRAYFKKDQPLEIRGAIVNLTPLTDTGSQLLLQAGSYNLLDGTTVHPIINTTDFTKFTDSLLSTAEGQFRIISVSAGAGGPVLTIESAFEAETVQDPDNDERYGTREFYRSPSIGSRFSIIENMSNPVNWESISEPVQLVDFGNAITPKIEKSYDTEGNETKYLVGGITGEAIILPLDADNDSQPDLPGFYSITYQSGITLPEHPQANLPYSPASPQANSPTASEAPHVEWYKGLLRAESNNGADKKLLEVVRIAQTNPLVIYAYDPTYEDSLIKLSGSATDSIEVNFHPGYKAYLFPEPAPASFNRTNILPGVQDNDKRTLIGLQSANTTGDSGFSSRISSPAILLARKIEEPIQPEAPTSFGLKVRPDATSKAAFTFDTKIATDGLGNPRNPFGLMFNRTSHVDILYALYKPETITNILGDLNNLTEDLHYNQRYLELANLVFDPANPEQFKVFEALTEPYGFPVPDKGGLTDVTDTLAVKKEKYKTAIRRTLLPLTEQTPIFSFIKVGKQTENKLPTIRSIDGNLLEATDPLFDPFPMIRRYTSNNETYVRFTDYSLNASSRSLYFYASSEVTVQLIPGPLSDFGGPVSILHTLPAAAPVISSFTIGAPFTVSDSPVAVSFRLSYFSELDNISKVRIYRTFDHSKTVSLHTMSSYLEVDITVDAELGVVVSDTFDDLLQVPLGETIYYRLAGIRTISNENDQPEDIQSLGSEIMTVNLVDMFNPSAPDLTYDSASNTLSWEPTTNKGTYYLFKQNARGNWEKIGEPITGSATPMSYELQPPLILQDEDGDRVYHRFKVKVENSSGLLNLTENELTI